jgi:hypothetical protein
VAIPVKLPAPVVGTEAQPEPKSIEAAAAEPPAADAVEDAIGAEEEAAGVDELPDAADEDELELHAAVLRARPAAMPVTARRRYFTVCSFERFRCR